MIWIVIIFGFLSYGLISLEGLFRHWDEHVHITTINDFSADVKKIPFPTVTICPKGWPADRFGFIRAYYNEFDVKHPEYAETINEDWGFFTEAYFHYFREALNKLVEDQLQYQLERPIPFVEMCYPTCFDQEIRGK